MEFSKYSSIENHYIDTFMDKIKSSIPKNTIFVATNKIDGANFSFYYNKENEMRVAKRTCLIDNEDNFNGSNQIYKKYIGIVNNIFDHINKDYNFTIDTIILDCEIFGGKYPHPTVKKVNNVSIVQGRIYYTPFNDVACYDMRVKLIGEDKYNFISMDKVLRYCQTHGMPLVDIMAIGTLEQMEKLNPKYLDPTYKRYNLPPIENNYSEGYVIKPLYDNYYLSDLGDTRVIFKLKNKEFNEISKKNKVEDSKNISEEGNKLISELGRYINKERFMSVLSKLDDKDKKIFSLLMYNLTVDAIEEYKKINGNFEDDFEKNELKLIMRKINKLSSDVVKKRWVQ